MVLRAQVVSISNTVLALGAAPLIMMYADISYVSRVGIATTLTLFGVSTTGKAAWALVTLPRLPTAAARSLLPLHGQCRCCTCGVVHLIVPTSALPPPPGALHWLTKPYVHQLKYHAASQELDVQTVNLLGRPVWHRFGLEDVEPLPWDRPVATFMVWALDDRARCVHCIST